MIIYLVYVTIFPDEKLIGAFASRRLAQQRIDAVQGCRKDTTYYIEEVQLEME